MQGWKFPHEKQKFAQNSTLRPCFSFWHLSQFALQSQNWFGLSKCLCRISQQEWVNSNEQRFMHSFRSIFSSSRININYAAKSFSTSKSSISDKQRYDSAEVICATIESKDTEKEKVTKKLALTCSRKSKLKSLIPNFLVPHNIENSKVTHTTSKTLVFRMQ